jgi:hypothetical protein
MFFAGSAVVSGLFVFRVFSEFVGVRNFGCRVGGV